MRSVEWINWIYGHKCNCSKDITNWLMIASLAAILFLISWCLTPCNIDVLALLWRQSISTAASLRFSAFFNIEPHRLYVKTISTIVYSILFLFQLRMFLPHQSSNDISVTYFSITDSILINYFPYIFNIIIHLRQLYIVLYENVKLCIRIYNNI